LLPDCDFVVVASILGDKDVDEMLRLLARAGGRLIATRSGNQRALPAEELARRAGPYFEQVDVEPEPSEAVRSARASEGREGVLVTGSLYLLASINDVRSTHVPWGTLATG
jgi:dihydrofolate synthase/folylpolyglutamate synthase